MKDLFSRQSGCYARFRPVYPQALYDFIYAQLTSFDEAWDCGTGNGQVARELAKQFRHVLATDLSEAQLALAPQADNITYHRATEQVLGTGANTFDLVTVATAIHWFDFDMFYAEVKRTAKPGAVIAAWCYSLMQVNEQVDALINTFCFDTLGAYWDPERKWVDDAYRNLPFPFKEITAPAFSIHTSWTLAELEGYLNSWSSVQHYIKANTRNPIDEVIQSIRPHWTGAIQVTFPLPLRIGTIEK